VRVALLDGGEDAGDLVHKVKDNGWGNGRQTRTRTCGG
jgi:hypothetical protein